VAAVCVVDGCWGDSRALGRCWGCYSYLRRHGCDRDMNVVERRRITRNRRRLDDELWAANVRRLMAAARR